MAEDSILTYETLYDILRKEKQESNLAKLDSDINKMFVTYLKSKISIFKKYRVSMSSGKKEYAKKQINNIRRLYKELLEKREKKILELAYLRSKMSVKEPINNIENILEEERKLLQKIETILIDNRENLILPIVNGKMPQPTIDNTPNPKQNNSDINNNGNNNNDNNQNNNSNNQNTTNTNNSTENITIRLTKDVPKFYGEDLTIYGPYNIGDIVNIPRQLANILTNKDNAKEIKVNS